MPRDPWLGDREVDSGAEPWAKMLRQRKDATIVLVDEFVSSGQSFARLVRAAETNGVQPPQLGLALFDLRPTETRREEGQVPVVALYDLPPRDRREQ